MSSQALPLSRWRSSEPVLRCFIALLLLWASVSKLSNPTEFLGSIYAYELGLPKTFLKITAIVLPWVELLCGLTLLAKVWTETALATSLALFSVFVLATGQAWARGLKISCGCFDFGILGLDKDHSPVVKFLESPGFAFIRNLALCAILYQLLRWTLSPSASGISSATVGSDHPLPASSPRPSAPSKKSSRRK